MPTMHGCERFPDTSLFPAGALVGIDRRSRRSEVERDRQCCAPARPQTQEPPSTHGSNTLAGQLHTAPARSREAALDAPPRTRVDRPPVAARCRISLCTHPALPPRSPVKAQLSRTAVASGSSLLDPPSPHCPQVTPVSRPRTQNSCRGGLSVKGAGAARPGVGDRRARGREGRCGAPAAPRAAVPCAGPPMMPGPLARMSCVWVRAGSYCVGSGRAWTYAGTCLGRFDVRFHIVFADGWVTLVVGSLN